MSKLNDFAVKSKTAIVNFVRNEEVKTIVSTGASVIVTVMLLGTVTAMINKAAIDQAEKIINTVLEKNAETAE